MSYLLNLSPEQVKEVKAALLYNQALVKYEIYKMGKDQKFFHFEKLQSEFDKAIEEIMDRRLVSLQTREMQSISTGNPSLF